MDNGQLSILNYALCIMNYALPLCIKEYLLRPDGRFQLLG